MHNVHHQNGYVTHGGTPHTQVAGGVKGGGGRAKEEEGRNRIKEGILVQTAIVHSCFFHHLGHSYRTSAYNLVSITILDGTLPQCANSMLSNNSSGE